MLIIRQPHLWPQLAIATWADNGSPYPIRCSCVEVRELHTTIACQDQAHANGVCKPPSAWRLRQDAAPAIASANAFKHTTAHTIACPALPCRPLQAQCGPVSKCLSHWYCTALAVHQYTTQLLSVLRCFTHLTRHTPTPKPTSACSAEWLCCEPAA